MHAFFDCADFESDIDCQLLPDLETRGLFHDGEARSLCRQLVVVWGKGGRREQACVVGVDRANGASAESFELDGGLATGSDCESRTVPVTIA